MKHGWLAHTPELPRGDIAVVFVVPHRLPVVRLKFLAEVSAARLGSVEGVTAENLRKFEEPEPTTMMLNFRLLLGLTSLMLKR